MDWEHVDWGALERLRDTFIGRAEGNGPYWKSADDLASYDFTFGRRIAWKWAAVLEPLVASGWLPPARTLVDWGCGTGIAARSMLAHFPERTFDDVVLWDHSPGATAFAGAAIHARRPEVNVAVADPASATAGKEFILVVSHVLNELDAVGRDGLLALAQRAAAVIWVEPGTSDDSRRLIAVREELRMGFSCLAPCPHDGGCGLLAPENARHWCHHFARPPTAAFTETGWSLFSRRLGIDLRSLPHSFLVLDRRRPVTRDGDESRMIGEPRQSGVVMKILRCRAENVMEVELTRRHAPALWRALDKGRHHGVFRWKESDGRIVSE